MIKKVVIIRQVLHRVWIPGVFMAILGTSVQFLAAILSDYKYDESSEYESDSETENVPTTSKPQKIQKQVGRKSEKPKNEKIKWRNSKLAGFNEENYKFLGSNDFPECMSNLETPADFFTFLFPNDLIQLIVDESNLKSVQDNINKPANITANELEEFIGITLFMSLVKLPSSRLYCNPNVGQRQVYEIMTCNRWEEIKRFLHFNDNSKFIKQGLPGHDKLYKVRSLIEKIRQQLLLVPKEEYLAIDEQIIPTKARHTLKQYNPKKPKKWGFKNLVLSGVSGFSYDFDIFAGSQSNTIPEGAPDLRGSGNIVTKLSDTIPRDKNHKIFFDNWFNSPGLQVYLSKIGLLPLTARLNRVTDCEMPSEKEMKQRGRGTTSG